MEMDELMDGYRKEGRKGAMMPSVLKYEPVHYVCKKEVCN